MAQYIVFEGSNPNPSETTSYSCFYTAMCALFRLVKSSPDGGFLNSNLSKNYVDSAKEEVVAAQLEDGRVFYIKKEQ